MLGHLGSSWRSSRTIALASVAAGLATPAVFLVAKSCLTMRTRRAGDREQRISGVVNAYISIRSVGGFSGVRGLLAAGVKRLESHEEIREALRRIERHMDEDTLGQPADSMSDLHGMLREVTLDGGDVVGYDAAVLKYRKSSQPRSALPN